MIYQSFSYLCILFCGQIHEYGLHMRAYDTNRIGKGCMSFAYNDDSVSNLWINICFLKQVSVILASRLKCSLAPFIRTHRNNAFA